MHVRSRGKKSMVKNMQWRPWADLPAELVSSIGERLAPIDLLSFSSVCKDWNSASSTALAKTESAPDYEPWLLLYGVHKNSGECHLVTESGKKFIMRLRELDGTTCLASNQGWLLVFKQGRGPGNHGSSSSSMFFFRPFSKTKIDLPECPISELSDHVAAFSCPPTSQDCTVCVVNRVNDDEVNLKVLHLGASKWIHFRVRCARSRVDTIKCAAYKTHKQQFYFFDHGNRLLTVDTNKPMVITWGVSNTCPAKSGEQKKEQFIRCKNYLEKRDMKKKLGLAADDEHVSFSTCGTQRQFDGVDNFFYNESITGGGEESDRRRHFKGVWIYPKFYEISSKDQTW